MWSHSLQCGQNLNLQRKAVACLPPGAIVGEVRGYIKLLHKISIGLQKQSGA